MNYYKHNFDVFETFRLLKDNGNGTALFLRVPEVGEPLSYIPYIRPELLARLYSWKAITKKTG